MGNQIDVVDVFLSCIDGSSPRRLPLKREDIEGLAWMPDGKALLLCMRLDREQLHIVRYDLASGKTDSLQDSAVPMVFPAISRDGHYISFTESHQTNKTFRLQHGVLNGI